ncbi:MAG: hypothetical protein RRC07_08285 [Anaerolineae bacterium]|nr:hypothetical protein [Anaerolineae bacterium]
MGFGSSAISRRQEIVLVVLLLGLAAFLRLAWPGLTHFQADEARLYLRALSMAQGEGIATHGIESSIGFPNSPVSVWLYALPLLVWPHVYAATVFTGLVNLLAVAGAWLITRRYWGRAAALVALLLFAVAPWALIHARRIWAQNLLAPLVVAWGIGALLAFAERRPRFIMLHLLALALAVQVHFAGLALLPASLLFLVVFRKRLRWRYVLLGVGLALATALPFLLYLRGQGNAGVAGLAQRGGGGLAWQPVVWRYLWLLVSGSEIHSLAGPEQFRTYLASLPPLWPVYIWLGLLMATGLGRLGWVVWQRRKKAAVSGDAAIILLVWLLAPPLFFLVFPAPAVLHYLLPSYPVPFIAAGVGFALLLAAGQRQVHNRVVPWPAWLLLLVAVSLHLWGYGRLNRVIAREATPGGFSTPLALRLEAAETAREQWRRDGGEIVVASSGEDPAIDQTAAIYDALLAGVPHRFVDVRRSALFPGGPATVLLAAEAPDDGGATTLYLEQGQDMVRVPLRRGEGAVRVMRVEQAAEPAVTFETPLLFANWVRLFGYDPLQRQASGSARWALYWRPGDNPDTADYHFFNHLLDGEGERIAQADAAAFAPWQWRAGDTVVSVFGVEVPETASPPLSMRVGIYGYPSIEAVPVLDPAMNPASDAVVLPAE